ncbi:unnamed protein product [Dovyalis caffra]|uniref:Rapid ALkalinization Factor n=1 Tax=Dovyalis caffra TaxID=77055 RepID=A0AAV1SET2_9ROSI|nr:unnamed protein product [Dovyalis caffra]
MSKSLMVFGLTLMVVCACFAPIVSGDEPPTIGYGAIGKDGIPGCSPKNPNAKACNEVPANPYDRGCEKENRCRNGRKLVGEDTKVDVPINLPAEQTPLISSLREEANGMDVISPFCSSFPFRMESKMLMEKRKTKKYG